MNRYIARINLHKDGSRQVKIYTAENIYEARDKAEEDGEIVSCRRITKEGDKESD